MQEGEIAGWIAYHHELGLRTLLLAELKLEVEVEA
jgi:hypothetical protein